MTLLGLTAAADAGIHKTAPGSGMTTLLIANKEIEYIMKIVKSLKESDLLIKVASETTENERTFVRTFVSRKKSNQSW